MNVSCNWVDLSSLVQFRLYEQSRLCCTTGWVNYANELSQAALKRSSQDAFDVIRLGWRAQQGDCVDSRRCSAFDQNLKQEFLFIYLFFTLGSISWGMTKIRSITKLYKTLLCSVYLGLFIMRIFKTFRPAGCTIGWKVYTDLKQAYVFSGTGGRTTPVVERLFMTAHQRISCGLFYQGITCTVYTQ